MLIDWRLLYHDKKTSCKGCKYEHVRNEILCPGCSRDKRDNYRQSKKVT